jgi:hypothetical protein
MKKTKLLLLQICIQISTICNDNILDLLQDLYMFWVPALPIIRSTILQLTVIGITYITLDREAYGNVHFKCCTESGGWSHLRG